MPIPDGAIEQWWRLVLDTAAPPLEPHGGEARSRAWIVERYHDADAARAAEEHFTRVVREGQAPDEVTEHALPPGDPVHLPSLLSDAFAMSTSEARRLIAQGGVKLDGETVTDLDVSRATLDGAVLQAGKRRFMRLRG